MCTTRAHGESDMQAVTKGGGWQESNAKAI